MTQVEELAALRAALEAIAIGSWYRLGDYKHNLPATYAQAELDRIAKAKGE